MSKKIKLLKDVEIEYYKPIEQYTDLNGAHIVYNEQPTKSMREPSNEEIVEKINEIIRYLNGVKE